MTTAMHDRIDRMILLDWPDEVGAPAFTHLHPSTLPASELLYIRELTVVADAAKSADVVAEAIEELASRASAFVPGVAQDSEAILFASATQVAAAIALGRSVPASLPRWLGDQLQVGQSAVLTSAQSLLASPTPIIAVLVQLHEWNSLGAVLASLMEADHHLIWQRLVRELDLVVKPAIGGADLPLGHLGTRINQGDQIGQVSANVPASSKSFSVSRRSTTDGFLVELTAATMTVAIGQVVRFIAASSPIAPLTSTRTQHKAQHAPVQGTRDDARSQTSGEPPEPVDVSETEAQLDTANSQVENSNAEDDPTPHDRLLPAVKVNDRAAYLVDRDTGDDDLEHAGASDETATWRPPMVSTGLGGVLYLINPLSRIDLAEFDLDSPDPWHLLAGVARELVTLNRERSADPLWQCMLDWSGAEPPDRLAHQAAYEGLAAYIRSELAFLPPEPTLSAVLCLPAQVVTVDQTIQVYFPLEAAELAVRKRGLDIDPGWIPGFTHAIRFLFGERP